MRCKPYLDQYLIRIRARWCSHQLINQPINQLTHIMHYRTTCLAARQQSKIAVEPQKHNESKTSEFFVTTNTVYWISTDLKITFISIKFPNLSINKASMSEYRVNLWTMNFIRFAIVDLNQTEISSMSLRHDYCLKTFFLFTGCSPGPNQVLLAKAWRNSGVCSSLLR